MRFFIKYILPVCLTGLLTYSYYERFYSSSPLFLAVLLSFGAALALLISIPPVKRERNRIFLLFAPFAAIYLLTYNFIFSLGAIVLSVIIALVLPRGKNYTKILFTDANMPVFIKITNRKNRFSVYRNIFCCLTALLLVFTFIFTTPSSLWLVRAFPIDVSHKETIEENVIVSGDVTAIAWYDENALLIESFYDIDECIPSPGREAGLMKNDIITHINGERALTSDFIVNGADETEVVLDICRYTPTGETKNLQITVLPVFSENDKLFRIGITYYTTAVMTSSVQTVTFINPSSGQFAATAHSSGDIYKDFDLLKGVVFSAKVTGRDKDGLTATPGDAVGESLRTDNYGSYGTLFSFDGKTLPLAKKHEFTLGKATLLSDFEGGEVKEYDICITGTYRIDNRDVLCFVVTDDSIIASGGITRGMSGSPVVQNGKLIAALSNMDEGGLSGYATFARDMAHSIYINQ